jgi:hypothetical protein
MVSLHPAAIFGNLEDLVGLQAGDFESQFLPYPLSATFNAALSAAPQMGIVKSYDIQLGRILIRTSMSMKSWGEDLVIQLSPAAGGTELRIHSSSRLQVVDWGKNRQNLDKFISLIASCLSRAPQADTGKDVPDQAYTETKAAFCCNCGARIISGGKFCSSCGRPV